MRWHWQVWAAVVTCVTSPIPGAQAAEAASDASTETPPAGTPEVLIECDRLDPGTEAMLEARARAELLAHTHPGQAIFRCYGNSAWLDWKSDRDLLRLDIEPTQAGDAEAWLAALSQLLDRDRTRRIPKPRVNLAFDESPDTVPSFDVPSARRDAPRRLWRFGLAAHWELWGDNAQTFGPRVTIAHREGEKGVALWLATTWPQLPNGFSGRTLEGALAFEWSPLQHNVLSASGGIGLEYVDIESSTASAQTGLIFGQLELQVSARLDRYWELVIGPGIRGRNRSVRVDLDAQPVFTIGQVTALFQLGVVLTP